MAHSTRTDTTEAAASPPLDIWSEQAKHRMECGLQTLVACLRGGQEMQKAQLDAAHLALRRHEELQQRLHEAGDLSQLLGLQAELWRFDNASATRYWQDLFDAALRMNAEMLRCQVELMSTGQSDAVKTAFQTMQNSLHTGIRPLDDLFNTQLNQALAPSAGARPH